jgi:HD-GYP domain-containing protein (c-di-GMP phosphodiesterase class II)
MEALEFASFLHDIGKIGVRDAVLLKPGPLDEEEWVHMRTHPLKGYEIASQIDILKPTMPCIRNHHERWDGKGYPDGLAGDSIPLSARIVAIADAYDAMATDRPYKKALPLEECEGLLRKNAGVMFDPRLVEIFVKRKLGALYREDDGGEHPPMHDADITPSSVAHGTK